MSVRTLLAVVLLVTVTPISVAMAAASVNLYLLGDSEPIGSMTTSSPPSVSLPDFDGDGDPGRTITGNNEGVNETNPGKYQQWEYDVSGLTVSVTQFVIWAAPKDFDDLKVVQVGAYLMDCGGSCILLDTATRSISQASTWTRVELPLTVIDRSFGNGRRLVVKITVLDSSDDDMWFAYATSAYNAHLVMTPTGPTTTTSTTTTTTMAPTTTTTTTAPTTTTTTTMAPTTTTTTAPTTTTTTTMAPTTTTTTAPTTTTTTGPTTTTTTAPTANTGTTTTESVATPQPDTPSDSPSAVPVEDADTPRAPIRGSRTAGGLVPVSVGNEQVTADLFQTAHDLEPEDGLMVAFSTLAETISLYWQAAVGLGSVAAILLWLGFWKRESKDEEL